MPKNLRPPGRPATGRVLGYVRVSTADQELGLDAQRAQLEAAAVVKGWRHLEVVEDNGSGTTLDHRPGLAYALDLLARGRADALAVTKLDRLARSVADFAGLLERSRTEGWSLVVLAMDVDTGTATGRLLVNVVSAIAEFEAAIIAERTREALAVKKLQGLQLGRPSTLPAGVLERIAARRQAGASLKAIADELNADQVPTSQGGRWHPSTVRYLLGRPAQVPAVA
jgi:DNA invertase Pin-like site-specific DNA recombinase